MLRGKSFEAQPNKDTRQREDGNGEPQEPTVHSPAEHFGRILVPTHHLGQEVAVGALYCVFGDKLVV